MYGLVKRMTSLRSGVIVSPFQIQSIFFVLSSCSLALQLIGCNLKLIPRREQTSLATSISKPTISPCSSLYPIGGKLSSSPKTNSPFACTSSQELSVSLSLLQPERAKTSISTARKKDGMYLFITNTPLQSFYSNCTRKQRNSKGRIQQRLSQVLSGNFFAP